MVVRMCAYARVVHNFYCQFRYFGAIQFLFCVCCESVATFTQSFSFLFFTSHSIRRMVHPRIIMAFGFLFLFFSVPFVLFDSILQSSHIYDTASFNASDNKTHSLASSLSQSEMWWKVFCTLDIPIHLYMYQLYLKYHHKYTPIAVECGFVGVFLFTPNPLPHTLELRLSYYLCD